MISKRKMIVVALALMALVLQCEKPDEGKKGLVDGRVLLLNGNVSRNGEPLAIGADVRQGDKIETADASSVEIVFAKGLIIRLGSNSKATLDLQTARVQLDKGWFAAVKNANSQQVEVVTPTATASVRGTSLCIKAESDQSTYMCTCNGTVHYHAAGLADESVSAPEHSAVRFVKEGEAIQKKPATLEFHSNADIEELAKKIDHPLDWSKP